jgi:DNA-binding NtrC family response regulator
VLLVTGYGTIGDAVACLQAGAANFLTKPFDNDQLVAAITGAALRAVARRKASVAAEAGDARSRIVAVAPKMREVMAEVDRLARLRVPVLVEGRSGTGKELIARALHEAGARPDRPFLAVNCAALPDTLLEAELFGHKRGAFTGAHRDHEGLFAQARGGTVFLDEIPSMSLAFQGKLLRVLEERRVRPLGATADEPVDFRLVAAANRDLADMIAKGTFREDLYYRLRVTSIAIPTLRERAEDVPALAATFVERAARDLLPAGSPTPALTSAALDELVGHPWPGNVRELENAIQQAVVSSGGGPILPNHLRLGQDTWALGADDNVSYDEGKQRAVERFQRRFVLGALERSGGNVTHAAEACGLTRAALQRILKDLGVDRAAFRVPTDERPPGESSIERR